MHTLPDYPCYLNGAYTPLCDAKISVMDRGFIFGDGIYEVVPVYAGRLFRFEEHMARLDHSLAELRIANPLGRDQWREIATTLVASHARHSSANGQNGLNRNHLVYIQITRGVALRDHAMPQDITPTVFAMATQMNLPSATQRSQGVACVTADDFRWEKAHIKSTSLLGAVFARQIGVDAGAVETVMFRNGYLSEAASSNVWLVQDGTLIGPPKDNLVLEGIRFGLMEDICRAQGIPFQLRRITREEVLHADELLLTSATKEVLAITTLDGQPVANGQPGPVYAQLYAGYTAATLAA
ncbi:D-amino acid aminotransferase [Rhodoferax sp. WC2427]|uniref:D-amino acid aminotransferase n=1 Tax=Rhodoferax sp. WC2427 TaxID=3234144 RepID=UPI0034665F2C